jgi:ribose/xylose/arabinose/galactoside ABC-type transport system permease subunit
VPNPAIAIVLTVAVVSVLMYRTRFGRSIYAVGGDREVARLSGIRVNRTSVAAYTLSGLFAASAGLVALSQAQVGTPLLGERLEFASITAVALGGISLYGGRGHIIGAVGGALLLTVLLAFLSLVGINPFYQELAQGIVILAAVAVYRSPAYR